MSEGNPGHADLILAEFQARVRAGEFDHPPDPAEEETRRGAAVIVRLGILTLVGVAIALSYGDALVTAGVVLFLALAVAFEVWLWRRRSRAEEEDPTAG